MSDELQAGGPEDGKAVELSAGQLLKQARESSGLHIAALAVAMKVPIKKLEALESDRYEELSGATFVRALASSVCRHLKMDAKPVLERLPQSHSPALVKVDDGLNTPFRKPGEMVTLGETWQKLRITVIAVVALLLGSILIFSMPTSWMQSASEKPTNKIEAPLQTVKPIEATSQLPPPVLPASATVEAISAVAAGASSAEKAPQVNATPASNPTDILVFKANADSWVEVLDRNGQLQVRKTIKPGETLPAGGQVPLSVTIGNADKTSVTVRGKPYDLLPVTRENIARFVVQ